MKATPFQVPKSSASSSRGRAAEPPTAQRAQEKNTTTSNGPNNCDDHFVFALIHNKANEVGIAAYNLNKPELILTQFTETTSSCNNTVNYLFLYDPETVLLSGTTKNSVFVSNLAASVINLGTYFKFQARAAQKPQITARSKKRKQSTVSNDAEETRENQDNEQDENDEEDIEDEDASPFQFNVPFQFIPRKLFNETKGRVKISELGISQKSRENEKQKAQDDEQPEEDLSLPFQENYYLAISAANALIDYVESSNGVSFAPAGLKITFRSFSGHLFLDAGAMKALELVYNNKTGKTKEGTLFAAMNCTSTQMGERLLRVSLLQPLADKETIEMRQDVVEEFTEQGDSELFFKLQHCLSILGKQNLKNNIDLDILFSRIFAHKFIQSKDSQDTKSVAQARSLVLNMACLKKALDQLPEFVEVLSNFKNPLLEQMTVNLSHPDLKFVKEEIDRIIDENVKIPNNAQSLESNLLFAVKNGLNPLLDVARRQYAESIDEIHSIVQNYKEKSGISNIKLEYNKSRGYFLKVDMQMISKDSGNNDDDNDEGNENNNEEEDEEQAQPFGRGRGRGKKKKPKKSKKKYAQKEIRSLTQTMKDLFIQRTFTQGGKTMTCSTEELIRFNTRLEEVKKTIFLITQDTILALVESLRTCIQRLYKLSETIALLDMLFSFAIMISSHHKKYVKPIFTEGSGPIAIKEGRHAIMDHFFLLSKDNNVDFSETSLHQTKKKKFNKGNNNSRNNSSNFNLNTFNYVPNDTFLTESRAFQILTGPNMSGKTFMLKQIALIVIMAQCGCFVPATFCSLRIVDKLFTRMSHSDEDRIITTTISGSASSSVSSRPTTSSFFREMQEMANIIASCSSNSLVLIDELGRGTSTLEGSSIAWAIVEYFATHPILKKAYVMFVTHFTQITELEYMYPTVKNYHMQVGANAAGLTYLYTIESGQTTEDRYGIKLARMLKLEKSVCDEAEEIVKRIEEQKEKRTKENISSKNTEKDVEETSEKEVEVNEEEENSRIAQLQHVLWHRLISLKHSTLDKSGMQEYLKDVTNNFNDLKVWFEAHIPKVAKPPEIDKTTISSQSSSAMDIEQQQSSLKMIHEDENEGQNRVYFSQNENQEPKIFDTSLNFKDNEKQMNDFTSQMLLQPEIDKTTNSQQMISFKKIENVDFEPILRNDEEENDNQEHDFPSPDILVIEPQAPENEKE